MAIRLRPLGRAGLRLRERRRPGPNGAPTRCAGIGPGTAGLDGRLAPAGRQDRAQGRRQLLPLSATALDFLQRAPAGCHHQRLARAGLAVCAAARRARRPRRRHLRAAGHDRAHDLGPGLRRQLHRWRGGAAQGPHRVRALRRRVQARRAASGAIAHQVLLRHHRRHAGGRRAWSRTPTSPSTRWAPSLQAVASTPACAIWPALAS